MTSALSPILRRTLAFVAASSIACGGPVDGEVLPETELASQALSSVHLPITNMGNATGRCFSEVAPPQGLLAAAAWDTGIDCATQRTWNATPLTGLAATPVGASLRSRAATQSHAVQVFGTAAGLVLDSRNDGIDDARNPNAKLMWQPAGDRTRPTYPLLNDPFLFPWHSAYGGTNPAVTLSFDAWVKQAQTFSGTVPAHATMALTVLEKTTAHLFYVQCKIYINAAHPTTRNTVMVDHEGTEQPMAISLLGTGARYCNVSAGSPTEYQTSPWAAPKHYDLRFTWGHLQNAIKDLNAAQQWSLPLTRDTYRLVGASLNLELGMRSGVGTGRAALLSGQYANWSLATVP